MRFLAAFRREGSIFSWPLARSAPTTSRSRVRFVTSSAAVKSATLSEFQPSLAIASPVSGERFGSLPTSRRVVAR